jgi:hypothetical protein
MPAPMLGMVDARSSLVTALLFYLSSAGKQWELAIEYLQCSFSDARLVHSLLFMCHTWRRLHI